MLGYMLLYTYQVPTTDLFVIHIHLFGLSVLTIYLKGNNNFRFTILYYNN